VGSAREHSRVSGVVPARRLTGNAIDG